MLIIPKEYIDFAKWDACVQRNSNGLIYATSAYLNAMTDNWSGLVINDYEAIMPLPWRKKWGIKYLYTPAFTQQLGLIGPYSIDNTTVLQTITDFVKYGDYMLNAANKPTHNAGEFIEKCNCILPLSAQYLQIKESYSKPLVGYLKKAVNNGLIYAEANINEAIDAYQGLYQERFETFVTKDYNHFKQLCLQLQLMHHSFAKKVTDKEGNIMAYGLFLSDDKRIYNLMPTTLPAGRKLFAMHFLMDNLIKEHAEQPLLLDFEGSDHPGIRQFYEHFGAQNEPYSLWHFNQLPWPLRYFKQ